MFMLQIRDLDTHQPLPGIEVGDVGHKIVFALNDNGYLILKDVKAPLNSLLSKYVSVNAKGEFSYSTPDAKKLMYGGMLNLRANMVGSLAQYIGKMATIATRYSFLRKQFSSEDKKSEASVIVY